MSKELFPSTPRLPETVEKARRPCQNRWLRRKPSFHKARQLNSGTNHHWERIRHPPQAPETRRLLSRSRRRSWRWERLRKPCQSHRLLLRNTSLRTSFQLNRELNRDTAETHRSRL